MLHNAEHYRSYGLSLWRWVSPELELMLPGVQHRLDADLARILGDVGLQPAIAGETPDLLLRYEAAPGVLVAELVDAATNTRVWRTQLRGDDLLAHPKPPVSAENLN